jgi:ribosomal protein L24
MQAFYYEGDQALITSGPLAGRIGKIASVDEPKQTVTLIVNIVERATLVEVDFMRLLPPDATEAGVGGRSGSASVSECDGAGA